MDFLLIYFSGTGNTELITDELKRRLEKSGHAVTTLSLKSETMVDTLDMEGKVIGFGFPVYKLGVPLIFNEFLVRINGIAEDNPFFLYSTYARFPGDSFDTFKRLLNRNKFHFIAEASFKSPSCGIAARKDDSDYEYRSVMFFEDGIDKKIDSLVECVEKGASSPGPIKIKFRPFRGIKQGIVDRIESTKYPMLQINGQQCLVCGVCVELCPIGNLSVCDNAVKIKDATGCLHCLRCMNRCLTNAISFGKLSVGRNRYTPSKRDELFRKALSGHREDYWRHFEKTIREWKMKTILYGITHWNTPEI